MSDPVTVALGSTAAVGTGAGATSSGAGAAGASGAMGSASLSAADLLKSLVKVIRPDGAVERILSVEHYPLNPQGRQWVVENFSGLGPSAKQYVGSYEQGAARVEALAREFERRGYRIEVDPRQSATREESASAPGRALADRPHVEQPRPEPGPQRPTPEPASQPGPRALPRPERRGEAVAPTNNRPEQLQLNQPKPSAQPDSAGRVERVTPQKVEPRTEPGAGGGSEGGGVDWGAFGRGLGRSVLVGGGVIAWGAALLAAGAVSAPFLVGAGVLWSVGSGINAFLERMNQGLDADAEDALGRALVAGASEMVPVVDVVGTLEVVYGYDYMTGRELTPAERSERAGTLTAGTVVQGGGTVAAVRRANPGKASKDDFVREVADTFKQEHRQAVKRARKKSRRPSSAQVSTEAHTRTQTKMKRRHGARNVVEEPRTGVSHVGADPTRPPRHSEGARGDLAHLENRQMIELKANAKIRNGRLKVKKKMGGKWGDYDTNQTRSQELFAESNGWDLHVVTSRGEIFTHTRGRWVQTR